MTGISSGYLTLFFTAFATQTLIPVPLDLIYLGLLISGFDKFLLTASIISGLTIGALLDYLAGKAGRFLIPILKDKKHIRFKRAELLYKKYGKWTLIFSFVPFVGKYFPAVAGFMKLETKTFILFYVGGKFLYYFLLLSLFNLFYASMLFR